jgi:hypothetical protein
VNSLLHKLRVSQLLGDMQAFGEAELSAFASQWNESSLPANASVASVHGESTCWDIHLCLTSFIIALLCFLLERSRRAIPRRALRGGKGLVRRKKYVRRIMKREKRPQGSMKAF